MGQTDIRATSSDNSTSICQRRASWSSKPTSRQVAPAGLRSGTARRW